MPKEETTPKKRNESPQTVALRFHREARALEKRQESAEARLEKVMADIDSHNKAVLALPKETQALLERLLE